MTPSTDWKEQLTPDEDARFIRYAEQLRDLQRRNGGAGGVGRGLHIKGNVGFEAEVEVLADIPEPARFAVFAQPAKYRAYVRYSNGSGRRQDDRKPDVRGFALKLVGVPGKKTIPGLQDATTQDFLMIRTSSQPFRTADEFVPFVRAVSNPLHLFGAISATGFGRFLQIAKSAPKGLKAPLRSLAETAYFTALPSQLGKYAVRYALVPRQPLGDFRRGATSSFLADELVERVKQGPISYELKLQFFVDEARTPIEDASVDWSTEVSPLHTVAMLTVPQQDANGPRGQKVNAFIEKLSFDPWHACEGMRPLGNIMRARNHAYRLSTAERGAAPEPDGTERFD